MRHIISALLLCFAVGASPARASLGAAPACENPDVLFRLSPSKLYQIQSASCSVPLQEIALPTETSDAFGLTRAIHFTSACAEGTSSIALHAIAGQSAVRLTTALLGRGGSGIGSTVGLGLTAASGIPPGVLSVYVKGRTGDRYWTRGALAHAARVQSASSTVTRSASGPCCSASSASTPECACSQDYNLPSGVIGVDNAPVDALLTYQGEEYHRVLRLSVDQRCAGPISSLASPDWDALTSGTYSLKAGIDPALGGGPRCAEFRPCEWNGAGAGNSAPTFEFAHNCYDYATNHHCDPASGSGCYGQPGFGSDPADWYNTPGQLTPELARDRAIADGLVPTTRDGDCGGKCKVAMIAMPGDVHWLRQHPDGTWSHKRGQGRATNTDCVGAVLRDPELQPVCTRDGRLYDRSRVWYFCVPDNVTIGGPTDIQGPQAPLAPALDLGRPTRGAAPAIPPGRQPIVTHDCYSTRLNPFYLITPQDSAEIEQRIAGLPPAANPGIPDSAPVGGEYHFAYAPGKSISTLAGYIRAADSSGVSWYHDVNDLAGWASSHVAPCEYAAASVDGGAARPAAEIVVLGNPFRGVARLVVRGGVARVTIIDVSGRKVRTISGASSVPEQTLLWDARNDSGVKVPAGAYFARAQNRSGVAYAKLVLME